MAVLIAGPSSVGKSTFIASEERRFFGADLPNVAYGFQIMESGFAPDALVHYNILHPALAFGDNYDAANEEWNFLSEPIFARIVNSNLIENCIVLVTPIAELIERIEGRTHVETFTTAQYDGSMWRSIVERIDLFRLYERFFSLLDRLKIPYRVLFSSAHQPQRFSASDRVFVHANLKGRLIVAPSVEDVTSVIAHPGSHYQSVALPHGLTTKVNGYEHLSGGRQLTFAQVLTGNLNGASVLDIGCALGDLLFNAERLGATRLVGIERNTERYDAACRIGMVLRSNVIFEQRDFTLSGATETFDYVYALNVIHHVHDFNRLLVQAAAATGKTLTIEFPTLEDQKFRELYGFSVDQMRPLNALPLVGISGQRADQSYVYSPLAIQRSIEEIGGFVRSQIAASPIADRVIVTFFR
jgi:ubiquinone/menaquinone biosynthesis C-methylase UbiE